MIKYHDEEWGVPVHNDNKHFEFIVLDSFQAGLSWETILNKRENFKKAFADFNPEKVAKFGKKEINLLLTNKGIIRNKLKIISTVSNADAFLKVKSEFGSFDKYIWQFTEGKTIVNAYESYKDAPVATAESIAMSNDLKKRGFKFVGPTICYAYMQAAGMVNDHSVNCFRYKEITGQSF
jgi:DNA-3-methyladenine glycosylase I